jgi:hypothetical protein
MNTFYSIIKISTNTLTNDSLSIGLLLHNGKQFWLQFSEERKLWAKKLLETNADIVDFAARQIQKKVDEMNHGFHTAASELFDAQTLLTADDFAHISQYSNGVLRFSEPMVLNDDINEEKFQSLFHVLIGGGIRQPRLHHEDKERRLKAKIDRELISRVSEKVHTNLELGPERIPGLFFRFNIDCIGLNGSFTAAKCVSFHRTAETIDRELSHYSSLIGILKDKYKRTNDHFYLIAEEPSNVESKEHKIWEDLSLNPIIKRIFPEEVEKVAIEIEQRNASKFLV